MKSLLKIVLFATFFMAMVGNSYARSAIVDTRLNVRAGPSTKFHVVDQLRQGKRVSVSKCKKNGWCYVRHFGKNGWVNSRYLSLVPYASAAKKSLNPWGLFSNRKNKKKDNGCQGGNCGGGQNTSPNERVIECVDTEFLAVACVE